MKTFDDIKFNLNKRLSGAGEVGIYDISDEGKVRVVVENADSGNIVVISGRIKGQSSFNQLKTITGSISDVINVSTYDEIKIECTAYSSLSDHIQLITSSFNGAGGSAIETIGVPSGENLTDFDGFSLTSSNGTVLITGDNLAKTIDLIVDPQAGAVDSVNGRTGSVVLDKTDVNLGNVDNTSDVNKPISTATQTALNLKYDASNPAGYITSADVKVTSVNGNIGAVVLSKSDIGLSNVDNTSDLNKPISTATQTALNGKQDSLGFTPENVSNKSTDVNLGTSNTLYPSQNAVKTYVDSTVSSATPDATTLIKGKVKLSGDLSGTADAPTVPGLALKYDASNPAGYVNASQAASAAPVQSVAGKTGSVVLNKSDVGLSNVDNTSDLDKPISTATQTAINNLENSFSYTQVVYVDKNKVGTYTADGSINKPYKSIEAMYNAITDASASKRYACMIAPGTYTESTNIRLKGWIDLNAFTTDTVLIGVSGGATLKWSNNNPGRVFIKDIGFSSGLEILNDNPSGTSGMVFDLDNVDAPSLLFRGRGGGRDFIQLRNDTRISGNCTIQSAATTIFDSTGIGNLTMNDIGCVAPDSFGSAITASIRSNYIGSVTITSSTYDVYTDVWGTIIASNMSITSNSLSYPCYFNYDATSYPLGTVTLSGANPPQLVQTSKAESIRYTPAVSGNWSSPAPTEVKAALDSLALNKISVSQKGAANGVVPLNSSSKIDVTYLPSYVDDVLEYADLASFPAIGETGKIYVALDTNKIYRFSGSAYIELSPSAVTSVNSYTGAVVLSKSDVGLSNVDNTSDLNKPISTATQNALNTKQDSLGFTPENVTNKSTNTSLGTSDTLYPSQNAVKTYVDNSISSATVPDATTLIKGKIKLAGDLSGTADVPTVPALANKYDISNPAGYVNAAGASAAAPVQSVAGKTGSVTLTKSDVGLSNVDNTSDLNKPISTATQDALNLKYDASNPAGYVNTSQAAAAAPVQSVAGKTGIVTLSKSDVGLSNVDNTSDLNKPISTATQTALDGKVDESREGQPNGIATLDGAGKVPSTQLPSYVDDVIEVANFASLPTIGETSKIYITIDTNICYRWSGSTYVQITSGAVASVNGYTGVVVLTKSDIGLSNVDNTSDLNKPISTATQLALDGKANTSHTQALSTITQSGASTGQVPIWNGSAWVPGVPAGTATWGGISGTLSSQTDLQAALDTKFDDPTGTTAQYIRGDGSLATFPTSINQANSLVTTVFNKSGAPIPKFSVVYINGGQGDLPTITLAQANNEANSSKTYGVVYADIPNMQSGQVIVNGALTGLNTDQFNPTAPVGDVNGTALYLSPTVPGGVTTTKPSAPDHMVYVATIVRTHQTQGVVEVRIQNGFELQELHNVQIPNGSAQNNQVLKYDSVANLWKNKYIGLATDIEETSFSGANNQSVAANVNGLSFNSTLVRSARIMLSVSVDASADLYEEIQISVINKNGSFAISTEGTGDNSGVKFSITNTGQLQYTSGDYSGFNSLVIKYRALTTSV